MSLTKALRGQAALEYILLTGVTIVSLLAADYLFKIKSDGTEIVRADGSTKTYFKGGFRAHFDNMQNVIRTGWK